MTEQTTLVLYSTLGCHLCEQAEALLQALPLCEPLAIEVIEISDDDAMLLRFGTRIPVLGWERDGNRVGGELDWPFDAASVLAFMRGPNLE